MNSCTIASIGAYERDSGLYNLYEQNSGSDRAGILRPLTTDNPEAISRMSKYPNKFFSQKFVKIDTTPLSATLRSLQPISVTLVSRSDLEPLWDHLVSTYHYLGYRRLLGHRLKYLVFTHDRPLAALSWSAPALKLRVRDTFIGWSDEQRKKYLKRIANNSRFLILPWVRVPHLASYILSRTIRRLSIDWQQQFDQTLLLLETFVDPRHFKGTSYKAANWTFLGHTYGATKQGQGYGYHGLIKEVYVYVLNPHFKKIISCQYKPPRFFHRPPPPTTKEVEELRMILRHADWNPDLVPCMDLTEEDMKIIADELVNFHKEFHGCLGRTEHQRLGIAYLSGLLSTSSAKSIEPIALEFLDQGAVRSLQRFLKTYHWDHQAMEAKHQALLAETISSPDGMINVDSSEFLKKGNESVGVARQYCGAVGKVENCQSGVFVGYSSEKGYGLLSCRLYMPEHWFSDEQKQRRKDTLVPEQLTFQTKPQIALELITKVVATGLFPAQWIGCDATFGADSNFLKSLPEGFYYFASIRSNTKVFLEKPKVGIPPYKGRGPRPKKNKVLLGQPQVQTVAAIAQSPVCTWTPVLLAEGAKGPILAEVARLRVCPSHNGLPADSCLWLFIRKTAEGQLKYAFSNAPANMPFSQMSKASTMRWPIEQCFQDGKEQLGMDQYEHRSYPAWHRHMIYIFLALHFLLRLRIQYKKNSSPHSASGSQINCSSITPVFAHSKGGSGNCQISH